LSSSKGSAADPAGREFARLRPGARFSANGQALRIRSGAAETDIPPWRGAADSSQMDLARVAQKTVVSRATNSVIASRMTSFANRSVRRSPKRPHGPPRQCQFWFEPRRSCRLSSQKECLRQGRRSSEEGSKPSSPLRPNRRAVRRRRCRADARAHTTGSGLSPPAATQYAGLRGLD
jgi:hypothetical protein